MINVIVTLNEMEPRSFIGEDEEAVKQAVKQYVSDEIDNSLHGLYDQTIHIALPWVQEVL